jgi:hypothetical protein
VPTLTCGLVRSNLLFAMTFPYQCQTLTIITKFGAHGENRTRDLSLTKGVLYH